MNDKKYSSDILYSTDIFKCSSKTVGDLILRDRTSLCPNVFSCEEYFGSLSYTIDDVEQLLGTTHMLNLLPWKEIDDKF